MISFACFLAAVIPTLNSLIDESERRQVFARRYQVLNGTLALGALTAGALTALLSRDALPYLFALTALSYLPITAQDYMTKLLEPRDSIFGLRTALGFWVAAYLVVALLALGPPEVAITGLLLYAVLFGLGECAYSCTYHPWLISTVPERDLTRANALANSVMGIGLLAGPSIGVALVTTGSATVVWVALAVGAILVVLTTIRPKQPVSATGQA